MAEFSKQYCERHMPDEQWDFDILEKANNIQNGFCIPIICEGYGFNAIGKKENGDIVLGFPQNTDDEYWKLYSEVIN